MKKFLLIFVLITASAVGVFTQGGEKSALLKLGYQSDYERFLIGVGGRINVTNSIRIAPDLSFYFPNDHLTGLDINVNVHYDIPLQSNLSIYPLLGLGIVNNRFSYKGATDNSSDIGFNLGAGIDVDLGSRSYLNFEVKYMFQDDDCAIVSLGYGIKF